MPIEQEALNQQLTEVPDFGKWSHRAEVRHLAALLNSSEKVELGVTGWVIESGKLAMRTWLVIVTSERLLCLLGSDSVKKLQMTVEEMKSAHTDARLGYYEVTVDGRSRKLILSGLPKESAVALASALSNMIGRRSETTGRKMVAEPTAAPVTNSAAELKIYMQKVERLEAELQQTKQRLAAVEQVIRNAQARSAAAAAAKK